MADVIWVRSKRCDTNSCAEWTPVPGGVLLRSSDHPDDVARLTTAELDELVSAYLRGEVVRGRLD